MPPQINILLTSFPGLGLGLPPTLSMPLPDTSTVDGLARELPADLPASLAATRVTLTTTSNKHLPLCSDALPSSFSIAANRLPLHLSAPLVGGGGGRIFLGDGGLCVLLVVFCAQKGKKRGEGSLLGRRRAG